MEPTSTSLAMREHPSGMDVGRPEPALTHDQPINSTVKDIRQDQRAQDPSDYPFMRAGRDGKVGMEDYNIAAMLVK